MNIKIFLFLCFIISGEIHQLKDYIAASYLDFYDLSHEEQKPEIGLDYYQFNTLEIGDAIVAENNNIRITERSFQKSNSTSDLFFHSHVIKKQTVSIDVSYWKKSQFLNLSLPFYLIAHPHYYFP